MRLVCAAHQTPKQPQGSVLPTNILLPAPLPTNILLPAPLPKGVQAQLADLPV